MKMSYRKTRIRKISIGIIALLLLLCLTVSGKAAVSKVHHELEVILHPERHLLVAVDHLTATISSGNVLSCELAPHVKVNRVTRDGMPVKFRFQKGWLQIPIGGNGKGNVRVSISYSGIFNDSFPEMTVNTDNPGYGVTGIISAKGTFLLAGSGWYPHVPANRSGFLVRVNAPEGITAVTAGRSLGQKIRNGRTITEWEAATDLEGIALSAGAYVVTQRDLGDLSIATYFFNATQPLSEAYLDAIERYIRMYEGLFGSYPFTKFAVVENFFDTGYGFPSYTLMGGRVLRLPFIIHTSLGHEIAHCWWGNGVRVDFKLGNWSEGLTAYVADHLYQERRSEEMAREHRRQWLRNYATLVDAASDFPLSEFTSRYNRPTKVVGYDKGAMFFHMIRRKIGDDAFWGALKYVFREKRFKITTWLDFREAFEQSSGCTGAGACLKPFFDQWVRRKGAPVLALDRVQRQSGKGGRWTVTGRLVQKKPFYDLGVKLAVKTAAGIITHTVAINGPEAPFSIQTDKAPLSLETDPDADLFRRLYPEEIPLSVNALKGAGEVLVVIAESFGARGRQTAGFLVESLGLANAVYVRDADLNQRLIQNNNLLFIGFPKNVSLLSGIPATLSVGPSKFSIGADIHDTREDALFAVFPHPLDKARVAGLFYAPGTIPNVRTALKITHYGRYSYLSFRDGKNTHKGVWPVVASPLIVRWEEEEKDRL